MSRHKGPQYKIVDGKARADFGRKQPGAKNSYKDSRPWSKLQRDMYKLLDPKLDLQIQCRVTKTGMSNHDGKVAWDISYWVTLGKGEDQEVLFDSGESAKRDEHVKYLYQKFERIQNLSQVIRDYIETPRDEFITKKFDGDKWGFVNILRCADRRIGKRSKDGLLALILTDSIHPDLKDACIKILERRFSSI